MQVCFQPDVVESDHVIGFLIIVSKLSDIFGRKSLIMLMVLLFTAFSAACGAAQNLTTLYANT